MAGGGVWYATQVYLPQKRAVEQAAANQRLEAWLSQSIAALNEWSSEDSFASLRRGLDEFAAGDGVDLSVVARLEAAFAEPYTVRSERMKRYEALLEQVKGFPLDADRSSMAAFDERVRLATGEFERELSQTLRSAWRDRKREIFGARDEDADISSARSGLEIRSVPSKALVYLDGERLSETPLAANNLRAGKHSLSLELENYFSKTLEVELTPGETLRLTDVELEPIVGSARIEVVGTRAKDKITIDVELPGDDPDLFVFFESVEGRVAEWEALRIGSYEFAVLRGKNVVREGSFEVREGELSEVTIDLSKP